MTRQKKNMSENNKFKINQTLLSAWLWSYKTDNGYQDFIDALNRKRKPQTKQMLDGIRFEGCVNAVLDDNPIDASHEWYKPITEISHELYGAQKQVSIYKDIVVNGVCFNLHGVLDFLKAGIIYDTKFSKTYKVGKYRESPQTSAYFYLVPEAYEFRYIICDGKYVYREKYTPEDVKPIGEYICNFMNFIDMHKLVNIYTDLWRVEE